MMMIKHATLVILAIGLCFMAAGMPVLAKELPAPKPAEDTRSKVFDAESFTLDNGMQVVVIPNHRVPVVTHMVWYKVGAADEPVGKSGIAHFLEHLLFKGSSQVGGPEILPGEFSKIVRKLGGNDNAFTSQDYTAYFQSIPAQHLEKVMRMEAGRMNGIKPPPDHVLSERQVILEERRQRTDNDPRGQFGEQLSAAAYINHPYGIPVIGWKHEMDALSYEDAYDFYSKWYAPNNAILVVSGDVTPAAVFQMAIDIYGSLPREAVMKRARTQSPPLNSKTTVTLEHPGIREAVVQTLFRAPSAHQNKQESLALEVLAEILGGGPSARLYQELVVKQKRASVAGMSYQSAAWDDGNVMLYASALPGQELNAVKAAYLDVLRQVVQDGVTPEELNDAKMRLQDQAIYARDSLTGPAMIIGYSLATGSTLDDVEYWPYDIAAVTAEQIQQVAKIYLNPDAPYRFPPVSGFLLPQGGLKE